MKAEDLMIGDWVIRRDIPEEPMRLYDMKASAGIAYLDQDGRGVTEKFENIEPIPLTKEILEKNEFVFNHDIFDGIYPMVNIIYCDYKLLVDDGKYINGGENNNIYYVHELQHALKLCGCKKEIIL